MNIQLPPTLAYPIPDDILDLKVTIDRSKCPGRLPNRVLDLERSGLSLPFTELMTHSTIFCGNRQVRPRPGETPEDARLRKVWQDVEDWNPRVVANATGKRRLIVDDPRNGEDSAALSKLLGEAVTLYVVAWVTQIPFRNWTPRYYKKHVRHDLEATVAGQKVIAEAKGRFNPGSITKEVNSIHDKFDATLRKAGKQRAFSRGIGVVYRLRSEADDSKVKFDSDVVIVDPEGSAVPSKLEAWRSLLLHYAHFFSYQAKFTVAEALVRLAERSDRDLEHAVRARERIFADPRDTRPGGDAWGRTTMRVGDVAFVGTVWDRLPTIHRGRLWQERRTGVFWGIALPVARALATAALDDIDGMPVNRWTGEIGEYVYSYADDATVWIGARDVRLFNDHP